MNLLDIYNLMQKGELTLEDAAIALDVTPKSLKIRIAKHGHRLPLVLATLDKIRADEITRDQAAIALNVTVRTINAAMASWDVKRPLKDYLIDQAAATVKWEVRKKFAIDFIGEHMTLLKAAQSAGVSDRQMRRWVSELINEHYGMVWKDLEGIPLARRRRMALEIEDKEGLAEEKIRLVQAISEGEKALKEVALDNVLARRKRRERSKRNAG